MVYFKQNCVFSSLKIHKTYKTVLKYKSIDLQNPIHNLPSAVFLIQAFTYLLLKKGRENSSIYSTYVTQTWFVTGLDDLSGIWSTF